MLSSKLATAQLSDVVSFDFCIVLSLDDDCNPGWGDCGGPLRHFGCVDGAKEEIFVH